jgi:Cu/Ag efflux pump CusA
VTVLAAALALLPILVAGNRAGLEIILPMAQVIVGGLVTAALVTLFIIPALYLRFGAPVAAPATSHAQAPITMRSQPDAAP